MSEQHEQDKAIRQPVASNLDGNGEETSGFVKDITEEVERQCAMQDSNTLSDLTPIYVSASGHARLFTARRFGKLYTLKCLKQDFLLSPVYKQALQKEFDIGLQMDHPYICRTIGMEEVPALGQCIVMEHVDGETLEQCMRRGALTEELACKVAGQLTEALDYLHSKQILHRDLKPSNIMVTFNGRNTKLIDFSLSDSDAHCVLKMPAGTTHYLAPEVTDADYKPNQKADIYSLGVVLKEMADATGCRRLKRCAQLCMQRRPDDRPETAGSAWANSAHAMRPQPAATSLTILCLLLALLAAAGLLRRHPSSTLLPHDDGNEVSPTLTLPRPAQTSEP